MYCLAFAMEKTGVVLHGVCVMSNHHHLVVTDPRGLLPDFLRELHRLTAKAMNALHGQWENFWAAEPCNVVQLVTDDDIADRIAYVATNPVAAGLVTTPGAWPGFLAWGEGVRRVARPTSYFREDGTCPQELSLRIEWPRTLDGALRLAADWKGRVGCAVAERLLAARESLAPAGSVPSGRKSLADGSIFQVARSYEEKFTRTPTFVAKARSVRERLREAERSFRSRYRVALQQWRSGQYDVVFPLGTWYLAIFHGARVERPLVT